MPFGVAQLLFGAEPWPGELVLRRGVLDCKALGTLYLHNRVKLHNMRVLVGSSSAFASQPGSRVQAIGCLFEPAAGVARESCVLRPYAVWVLDSSQFTATSCVWRVPRTVHVYGPQAQATLQGCHISTTASWDGDPLGLMVRPTNKCMCGWREQVAIRKLPQHADLH